MNDKITAEEILETKNRCTITEDASDENENYYFKWIDALQAMEEYASQFKPKANQNEQVILSETKEFAEAHNIPFDKRHEDMILNAVRASKPKAVEVEKLEKKFFDDCTIPYTTDGHLQWRNTPHTVWQWIQDNCLSQANEVKQTDAELRDKFSDTELKRLIWEEWEGEIKEEDPRQMVYKYMIMVRDAFLSHSHELGKKEEKENGCSHKIKALNVDGLFECLDCGFVKLTK